MAAAWGVAENLSPVSFSDVLMRLLLVLTLTLLWHPDLSIAGDKRDKDECRAVKEEIRRIQARMRRGYSAAEGVKLNAKLLELRERRLKVCR